MSLRKENLDELAVEGIEKPLSVAAVRKLTGLSQRGVYDAFNKGEIAACKQGSRTVVFPSELRRYMTMLRPYTPAGSDWHRSKAGRVLAKQGGTE